MPQPSEGSRRELEGSTCRNGTGIQSILALWELSIPGWAAEELGDSAGVQLTPKFHTQSLFPGCPEAEDLLSVCWECLFPHGCKTQRVSSKAPARTSCSGRDHRPQTPSGALPSAALHTKFSRDIPLLTRTPGKRDSSGHCKERINEPRAHKGTEGKELKLGLHLTHLLHVKLQDDTHDNQVHV